MLQARAVAAERKAEQATAALAQVGQGGHEFAAHTKYTRRNKSPLLQHWRR